jgi:hypothetical protein
MAFSGTNATGHAPIRRQRAEARRWGRASEGAKASDPIEGKERQLVLTLVAQLGDAQFARADQARVARLWQEVAALEIDPERVIRLLYGGQDLGDRAVLAEMDRRWPPEAPRASGFAWGRPRFRRWAPGAGRRSVPPAALPAHR